MLLTAACGPGALDTTEVEATPEVLVDGPVTGVAAASLRHLLYGTDESLTYLDAAEQVAAEPLTWTRGTLASATLVSEATISQETVQNGLLIAYGDRLLHAAGAIGDSPASAYVQGTVVEVRSASGVTALRTAERVYVARRGTLREVEIDSAPLGIEVGYDGVVWVATAEDLIGLDPVELGVFHHLAEGVRHVRRVPAPVDGAPGVWAVGERLHHFDGRGWDRYDAPGEGLGLVGDGIPWLVAAEQAWQISSDGLSQVTAVPAHTAADADAVGRLVLATAEGLRRLSVGRPIVVHGLEAGDTVRAPRQLVVVPTAKDRVQDWSASVDGTALPRLETGEVLLDPMSIAEGSVALDLSVTWDDGETLTQSVPFTSAPLLSASWLDDVGPIHAENCAQCHEGTTSTVLDGYDAWVERYDDIHAAVSEQRMPLGSDPLSAEQIATLEAWAASGFPEE